MSRPDTDIESVCLRWPRSLVQRGPDLHRCPRVVDMLDMLTIWAAVTADMARHDRHSLTPYTIVQHGSAHGNHMALFIHPPVA